MQVGDLVRCNVTKDPNTVGVVVAIIMGAGAPGMARVEVLTKGKTHQWSSMRLEVINASR
jgi:hypothetical protein